MPEALLKIQPFQRIANALEGQIAAGKYPPGTALPSRNVLVREFGAARATIDRSIALLVKRGRLSSRHGSGTYVLPPDTRKYRVAIFGASVDAAHIPLEFAPEFLPSGFLASRADWKKLLDYDGVLFIMPDAPLMAVARAAAPALPVVLVNRFLKGVPCVTTDFAWAYQTITHDRLDSHPGFRPVYLDSGSDSPALVYRRVGFLDACRQLHRRPERIRLDGDFTDNVRRLHERLPRQRAVIVSDSRLNTGAFMRWAAETNAALGDAILYSDFDNDYGRHVWGLQVTSFQQNLNALQQQGADLLLQILRRQPGEVQLLVRPKFCAGDT